MLHYFVCSLFVPKQLPLLTLLPLGRTVCRGNRLVVTPYGDYCGVLGAVFTVVIHVIHIVLALQVLALVVTEYMEVGTPCQGG